MEDIITIRLPKGPTARLSSVPTLNHNLSRAPLASRVHTIVLLAKYPRSPIARTQASLVFYPQGSYLRRV